VLVQSLLNGSTRTCGAGACRVAKVKADKAYHPRGTSALTLRQLQGAWAAYHRTRQPLSLTALAEKYQINRETLRSLFRAVRKCGGIESYTQHVNPPEE
jgi:response regulator of citrate/malate metabolism